MEPASATPTICHLRDRLPPSILRPLVRFALPAKKTVLNTTLGILGAIIVGALGSGVWELLLGPAIRTSTRWTLDFASLGLTSYKNRVYHEIAADNQSLVDVQTLFLVTIIMYALVIGVFLFKLSDASRLRQEVAADPKSVGRLRLALYVSSLVIGFTFVNQFISLARLSYVNSADAHYHHVLRVDTPYLDSREQAEVESDFAQISSSRPNRSQIRPMVATAKQQRNNDKSVLQEQHIHLLARECSPLSDAAGATRLRTSEVR